MRLQRLPFFTLAVLALPFAACDNTAKHNAPISSPSSSSASTNAANSGSNANADAAPPKPDYIAIAQKVVTQCAGVKAGGIAQVSGDVKDAELLEEITLAVRKLGAFPLMQMGSFDETRAKRALTEMPESFYAQTDQASLKLAGLVNAHISITNYDANNLSVDIPQERIDSPLRANRPVAELQRHRNIRNINFGGNGLYPSKRNAERLGLSQAELAQIFWNGVNTDYAQLQTTGEQYRQLLAASQEVHLTHANGTDLKVSIAQRPVFVSDGVVSTEDIKRGGPAVQVWLPAGEVYVTAVPGTAEGHVVIDHRPFNTALAMWSSKASRSNSKQANWFQ